MNSYVTIPLNEETPLAMSRVSKFGSKQLDGGLPNVDHIISPFDNTLSISYYLSPMHCEYERRVEPAHQESSSRRYLCRLITCAEIAARNRSYVLRMRRKAIARPEVIVASIRLNMKTVLAMLSIPRDVYKRCCTRPALSSLVAV